MIGAPAVALYERAGWHLAGTQPATWTDPDGTVPLIRCYVAPRRRRLPVGGFF